MNSDKITKFILSNIEIENFKNQMGYAMGLSGIQELIFQKKHNCEKDVMSKIMNNLLNLDTFSYCNGISGILDSLYRWNEDGFIVLESDFFNDINLIILNKAIEFLKHGYYDYLHGGLGLLLYLSNFDILKDEIDEILLQFISSAVSNENDRIIWTNKFTSDTNSVNFSLSHGLASIVNILSVIQNRGIKSIYAYEIIDKLYHTYIFFEKKYKHKVINGRLPSYIGDKDSFFENRLSWCYGSLGIGYSFFKAGKTFSNEKWETYGLETMSLTLKNQSLSSNYIVDHGICHGIFGIALFYLKIYEKTCDSKFQKAANYWYEIGLKDMKFKKDNIGLFSIERGVKVYNDYSFLTGLSGIALAISKFENLNFSKETKWERFLLL